MLVTSFLISFIIAMLLVPGLRKFALRKGWIDNPDGKRKIHTVPTPNVGGLAIAASFGLGLVYLILIGKISPFEITSSTVIVVVGALVVLGAGFYDDLYQLGFKKKFIVQITVAYLLLHAGFKIDMADLPFMTADPYEQSLYSIPLTMLWVVGIMNAINLIDGLDGLAAGVSLIAFACLGTIFSVQGDVFMSVISLLIAGALAAFLMYNFNPASIFMGDSGSLFLGYMLSLCTLSIKEVAHENSIIALLVPVVIMGLPLLDTTFCIVRRVLAGRSPFSPDDDHIHHRLARLWSRQQAVLIMYGAALWFGVSAILLTRVNIMSGIIVISLTAIGSFIGVGLISESPRRIITNTKAGWPGSDHRKQFTLKEHSPDKIA